MQVALAIMAIWTKELEEKAPDVAVVSFINNCNMRVVAPDIQTCTAKLQGAWELTTEYDTYVGTCVNNDKCKLWASTKQQQQQTQLTLENLQLAWVSKFKLVGTWIHAWGRPDVQHRHDMVQGACVAARRIASLPSTFDERAKLLVAVASSKTVLGLEVESYTTRQIKQLRAVYVRALWGGRT